MKPDNYCVSCKGTKNLCGLGYCPVLRKIRSQERRAPELKEHLFGRTNEAFVGSSGYPDVSWGPVLSLGAHYGARQLYEMGYGKAVEVRAGMVKGRRFGGIRPNRRSVLETQEAALSVRPVDLEVDFSRKPVYDMRFSSVVTPAGASAPIRRVRVCENPKIPKKVDSLIGEGRKAREAAIELYGRGLDNYYISSVLSVGKLGEEGKRVLVPTRWSITATDDMLGKHLMERVRTYKPVNRVWVFTHESYSNHYEIIVAPGAWEFENFEAWCPKSLWNMGGSTASVSSEYEPFSGRSKYASAQAGAYYAMRLAALEFLDGIRRQGRVVAIREVYEGYQVPVGVFQVRENARDAFGEHEMCSSLGEAVGVVGGRLRLGIGEYVKRSRVIGQRNLLEFL